MFVREKTLIKINNEEFHVLLEYDGLNINSFKLISKPLNRDYGMPYITNENQLIVIDSIKSGKGRTPQTDFVSLIMHPILSKLNLKFTLVKTKTPNTVKELACNIDPLKKYTLIFVSGDTTISEFINYLPNTHDSLNIYPIPMGTGNAWASSLNLKCPVTAFQLFLEGKLKSCSLPLYKAVFPDNFSLKFFIILSLGFHANLIHLCNNPEYRVMGAERFKSASKKIFDHYDLNCRITISDIDICANFAYFALINTPNLEHNYLPSPLSNPLAQELHLVGYKSSLKQHDLILKIMQGYSNKLNENINSPGTVYKSLRKGCTIEIHNDMTDRTKFELCLDGQLTNLLDHRGNESTSANNIRIEFLDKNFNIFSLTP